LYKKAFCTQSIGLSYTKESDHSLGAKEWKKETRQRWSCFFAFVLLLWGEFFVFWHARNTTEREGRKEKGAKKVHPYVKKGTTKQA
jgi:hypothetical protein